MPLIEASFLKSLLFKTLRLWWARAASVEAGVAFRDTEGSQGGSEVSCTGTASPDPDQDPTDAGRLNRKIIHLYHNGLVMATGETCRNLQHRGNAHLLPCTAQEKCSNPALHSTGEMPKSCPAQHSPCQDSSAAQLHTQLRLISHSTPSTETRASFAVCLERAKQR